LNGTTKVTLQVKDASGNNLSKSGLSVAFVLVNATGGDGTFCTVTDNKNDTYTAMFKGTVAGTNEIMTEIGTDDVTSNPATITIL
jgi:hypothetical protein